MLIYEQLIIIHMPESVDACVESILADPNFKPKDGKTKKEAFERAREIGRDIGVRGTLEEAEGRSS